jgi:hypothetical protein
MTLTSCVFSRGVREKEYVSSLLPVYYLVSLSIYILLLLVTRLLLYTFDKDTPAPPTPSDTTPGSQDMTPERCTKGG